MAPLMMLMLALLSLLFATTCVTVQAATTKTFSKVRTTPFTTLDDGSNATEDVSLSTTDLTAVSKNEFGSKTSPAAATMITAAVTTATTAPLGFLRTNRTRLTRATTSTTTTSSPQLEVGSSAFVSKKATVSLPVKSTNEHRQRYDRPEDTEEYIGVPDNPKYYSHSKRMSYSSSTGSKPRFSSSEEYFHLPLDEVLGSESVSNFDNLQPASRRSSSGEIKGSRHDCRMVHKPMPDYLEYTNGGGGGKGSSGHGKHKPMMTCYVCGKKDDPFSNGGYTEDCDVSPTNQKDIYVNRDDDYDTPKAKATQSHGKLYAGDDGQSPYLTGAEKKKNVATDTTGNINVRDDYDPYYGNDDDSYYGDENGRGGDDGYGGGGNEGYGGGGGGGGGAYPQATDSSGAVYDNNDNYDGSSRGYDDGAETDKSSCKIVYKGKMKCRVCGDPKEGGAFDEQCDYEKDAPEQHHSRAYDYSSNNEKKYRSDPHSGSRGSGRGGRGHDNDYDDDGYKGYEDDGYYGSENYPRYDNYGTGTGFDPYYRNTGPNYNDGNTNGYQRRNGPGSYESKEEPEASTTISDKKDVSSLERNGPRKRNCKVTYKDVTSSYSDYDTKNKKKPKMKCLVCNGDGGVTEECSYNGAGELTASFPGSSSDLSSFFGRDHAGDHSFYNPTEFDGFHDPFF